MSNNLRYDYVGYRWLREGADWIGCRPDGLQLHFHDDVQASVVWNGHRDYRIDGHLLRLQPGQLLLIPNGRAHHALPSLRSDLHSTEFYLAPDSLPAETQRALQTSDYLIADEPALRHTAPAAVGAWIAAWIHNGAAPPVWRGPPSRAIDTTDLLAAAVRHPTVTDAARALDYSREGFIRAFSRQAGMTPHAYRINDRLNLGRQLLRQRESISDIAYATGFSDQSHFGRMFLRYFGATPGQFRAAHAVG